MRYEMFSFRSFLALTLLWLNVGNASRDYQLVLNFQNTTAQAESTAIWWAGYWFTALDDVWFNCDFLEPGEKASRGLEGKERPSDTTMAGKGVAMLRGQNNNRHLQLISCPSSCSSSGSAKCKSLGCAFCGRCRRDRQLQATNQTETRLTPEAALKVEKWFNSYLMSFCYSARGCMMYAKIFRVLNNGTTYPLTGTTIAV